MLGRLRYGRIQLAVVVLPVVLLALGGIAWLGITHRPPSLPTKAELSREGFGTPVHVGMAADDAAEFVKQSELAVVFITPEELAERNLYAERPDKQDLIAAIVAAPPVGTGKVIKGLRGYLADAEHSKVTLAGQPAAGLSSGQVKELYGEPFNASTGVDGRTHLTYYFADPQFPGMALKLTTSHEYDGRMFSLALEHEFAPQQP